MKARIAALIILVLLLLTTGCTQNSVVEPPPNMATDMNQQIASLEDRNKQLEQEISNLSAELTQQEDNSKRNISIEYTQYDQQYRLIHWATSFFCMPDESSSSIGRIAQGTLAKVYLAGRRNENGDSSDTWLFVYIASFDTPGNNYGWVKESDTEKYTLENQNLVTSPVTIPKGTKEFDSTIAEDYDRIGLIEKWDNEIAMVMFAGGYQGWYKRESIVYPSVE